MKAWRGPFSHELEIFIAVLRHIHRGEFMRAHLWMRKE